MVLVIDWWKQMKNKPLFFQFTWMFSVLIIFVGLVFIIMIPSTLKSFFTDEIYRTIEESQLTVDTPTRRSGHMGMGMQTMQHNVRSAQHIFLEANGNVIMGKRFSKEVLNRFYEQAVTQQNVTERYELDIDDQVMLYVITKKPSETSEIFQVSYMWDTYRKELTSTLLKRMYVTLSFVLLAALSLALVFAKRIVKPIEYMKESVTQIAKKNWYQTFTLDRKDELGALAESIDQMRVQLKEQDEAERMFLQQISHDLKTPVMVIRSYADALKEGIYPTGSIEGTADIIDKEAKNLEKKIKDLLFITKLDYLNETKVQQEEVFLNELLEQVILRLHPYRNKINIIKNIEALAMIGNKEQLTILFENLIDNALKYAEKKIEISGWKQENSYCIQCKNDGEIIEEEIVKRVFQPFVKGKKGNFGLGLTIMKRIVELHNGVISIGVEDGETVVNIQFLLDNKNEKHVVR